MREIMVPSCQSLCRVPAVVAICNFPDVKKQIFSSSIGSLRSFSAYNEWSIALQRLVAEILKNSNPILKNLLPISSVPFIGLEMLKFASFIELNIDYINKQPKFVENFINGSIFTSRGTIDKEKAARQLTKKETLCLLQRYKIACYFCLTDVIPELWHELRCNQVYILSLIRRSSHRSPGGIWSQYLWDKYKYPHEKLSIRKYFNEAFYMWMEIKNMRIIKLYLESTISLTDYEMKVNGGVAEEIKLMQRRCLNEAKMYFENSPLIPCELFLSEEFEAFSSIVPFLLRKNQEDMINTLRKFDLTYTFLKYLLFWPFREVFIQTSVSVFHILRDKEFYVLLSDIIEMIEDFGETYNYRFLLREFWIKSPSSFKRYVIYRESQIRILPRFWKLEKRSKYIYKSTKLLLKLLHLTKFEKSDEDNFHLMLESTSPLERDDIAGSQVKFVHRLLLCGKFRLVDLFIDSLISDEEMRISYKRILSDDPFWNCIFELNCSSLVKEIVNWLSNSDETLYLKLQFFLPYFDFSFAADLFITSNCSFLFLYNTVKLFLDSEENISRWKKGGNFKSVFSKKFIYDYDSSHCKKFDKFLDWFGFTDCEILDIKWEILVSNIPHVACTLFLGYDNDYNIRNGVFFHKRVDENIRRNIFYLCAFKKEKVVEFIVHLRECFTKTVGDFCIICSVRQELQNDKTRSFFICYDHKRCFAAFSERNLDKVFSEFLQDILMLNEKRESRKIITSTSVESSPKRCKRCY